ncbi:hypothetical protein OG946_35940 [Streptomyces sp. NBC_01808]|uniref:hypothetical protein n=1 Tax=Streptomyces sp. NBC_01808 TaxID=2975947 RepID=UPI002DD87CE1|nr:hypothetical protein [Streptomyces sp. NBC_01808]WSA35908.1 hypothetical protein OG946_00050 [Streptomyces sp. NBC_01808]WSA42293.1 hypothetical protein OG946_35940 [Streptomyces sp. NBC_01808]
MDPELAGLASVAAATVVQLLTTAGWERAQNSMGALWRRVYPDRADTVESELEESRAVLLAAREDANEPAEAELAEAELVSEWQGRLRRLLAAEPALAAELRRILAVDLSPEPPGSGREEPSVTVSVRALDSSRVYVAGRDQHITGGGDR